MAVAKTWQVRKVLVPPHATSREDDCLEGLPILTVRGAMVWQELPWLVELYQGEFRRLYQTCINEKLLTTEDRRYSVVINVQENDGSRYECHVDTNPVEALLYVTSHPEGTGGELVIANSTAARTTTEVNKDCTVLYPQRGHLVFFDARLHPHYVRPLRTGEIRVAVGMNYYLPSFPESTRPDDLNEYLYGRSD